MWNGIGIGIGRQQLLGGGVVFDTDYQAILNYATAGGITLPREDVRTLQNQLMLDIKSAGAWDKLDVFSIWANIGSSAFADIDWRRTIRLGALTRMTPVSSPVFTNKQGFTGDGISSHIDTNFNPAVPPALPASSSWNYTRTNASRYYFHFSGSNTIVDGIQSSASYNRINLGVSSGQHTINSINNLATAGSGTNFLFSTTQGIKSIHRTNGTTVICYNDKVGTTFSQTDEALRSANQLVLKRSTNSVSNNTSFGYAMGASMTAENNAFVDALNNYMTELAKLP